MAIQATPSNGSYISPISVTLLTTTPAAFIRYTLDGSDPRTYLSPIYTAPIVLTVNTTIKAVEVTENISEHEVTSDVYNFAYTALVPADDEDQDGITNAVEWGQDPLVPRDTNTNGTPDYLDSDSDSDGLPDVIEGTDDFNNNAIPNYRDPAQVTALNVSFIGLPNPVDMVVNVPITFRVRIRSGAGTMLIANPNSYLLGITTTDEVIPVVAGQVFTYTIMLSECFNDAPFEFGFSFRDNSNGHYQDFNFLVNPFVTLPQFPFTGIKITWTKNLNAISYRIYRQRAGETVMSPLVQVPADNNTRNTQWYLDRSGLNSDRYSVSAVDADGVEGAMSLPRHSPDSETSYCLVQGNVTDVDLEVQEDVRISYRLKEVPSIINNTLILRNSVVVATDARGYFEFRAPQGSLITLIAETVGLKKDLIIPRVAAIDIKELLALPQNQ